MIQIIFQICSRAHSKEHLASTICEEFLSISLVSLRQEIKNVYVGRNKELLREGNM